MNTLEELENEAYDNGLEIVSYPFQSDRIKGLYCDNVIALSKNISTSVERECILAEEIAHYYTSNGDITDMSDTGNCKQELKARLHAYNRKIGLQGIIKCHNARCKSLHDMAECLNVTERFLDEAIACYRAKYGMYTTVDNYIIVFEPHMYVMEKIQ